MHRVARVPAALIVISLLAALVHTVLTSPPAAAHGAPMQPGSRTFLCWKDGLSPAGNIVPINPACAGAVAESGDNSLYNWFSVLRSDGAGRTTGFIPDGKLCSGGNPGFSGYDRVSADWPVTHLTSGAPWTFSYNAWAAHPGWFSVYVTRDGWDQTRPLTWSALEATPFAVADHPRVTGAVGTLDGQYRWAADLPSGKSGRHVIYMVWKRSDSAETFYSCSDVVFDGGNGEVTGVNRGGGTDPTPNPTPTPSPTVTSTPTPTPTTTTPPPAGDPTCMALYEITNRWPGGHQAAVTVMNHGAIPMNGWTAAWRRPDGQTVSSVWNGTATLSGADVSVRNLSWNAVVPPDGSTTFGLTVAGNESVAPSATCRAG